MFETCSEIRDQYSDYVDGIATQDVLRSIRYHLQHCAACEEELDKAQALRDCLRSLPRRQAPPEVDLNLRVRVSQELNRNVLSRLLVRLDNQFRSLLLPATGGLVAAIFCFCLLMGSEMAPPANAPDVPLSFVTPARVVSLAPFNFTTGDKPVVVETYIGADGQVLSYKVLSGQHSPQLMHNLDRMIYYSRYTPATSFGSPTEGEVVLSLRQVTIRG
ncbi:MAG TPA: zf-HC2 domain-containing protein [Terriglobia bacterium]|nr:zf-HC2 domain-containing protein [Terriglobia bacterium]